MCFIDVIMSFDVLMVECNQFYQYSSLQNHYPIEGNVLGAKISRKASM